MFKSSKRSENPLVLPYEYLCQQIKPGDVIAFSAVDVPSTVVKLATQSVYVHVAIVLSVDCTTQSEYAIVIAESHVDARLPSLITTKHGLGVQLQWLSRRLGAYRGLAWWAPLKQPLPAAGLVAMQTWLREIERARVPYDFVQAIEVGIEASTRWDLDNSPDASALFCSELVVYALQLGGAIDSTLNPAEQTPASVMEFPCLEAPVLIKNE